MFHTRRLMAQSYPEEMNYKQATISETIGHMFSHYHTGQLVKEKEYTKANANLINFPTDHLSKG